MSLMLRNEVEVHESHFVHFYKDNRFLSGALLEYIKVGVEKGDGIIIIATEAHIVELCKSLPEKVICETRFVDAHSLLKSIFQNGILNTDVFTEKISSVLNEMELFFKRNRIYVELVDLICEKDHPGAALELEVSWNKFLHNRKDLVVMCSYNLNNLTQKEYDMVLQSHSFSSGNEDENSSIDSLCKKIAALEIRNSETKISQNYNQQALDLKERVVHSLKLSDIGEITAGLSHELMNPITIIGSYSQTIAMAIEDEEFESKEFVKQQLSGINSTVLRMASLVKNILSYSNGNLSKEDFLIVDTISDALILLKPILKPHNVSVHFSSSNEPIYMNGDSGQILQVIFNLITNARDAISASHGCKGGIIHISVDATDETNFKITCSDNGKGIDGDTLMNMWKPFYTTKPPGKGTGLGLSIIKKIIKDNHGSVSCQSVIDQGTSFTITLPRVFQKLKHPA